MAEKVRRELEARLALGDLGVFSDGGRQAPTFDAYADHWLKDYARMECKTSTADGYEGVLRQYLRPRFGKRRLDEVKRDDIKAMVNDLIALDLSRNTIRNALCVIRGMFNQAIEAGKLESNPAARLGRFTRTARVAETKGTALTAKEAHEFLEAAKVVCPEYYPLFLTALRAGLRRGSWSRSSGVTSNSAGTMTTRTGSSLCSTTTCDASTRRRKARKAGAWISLATSGGH